MCFQNSQLEPGSRRPEPGVCAAEKNAANPEGSRGPHARWAGRTCVRQVPLKARREAGTPGEARPQAPSPSQMWVPPLVYLEIHLPLPALQAIRSSRCQLRRLCKSHAKELGCFRLSPASTPAPRPGSRPGLGVCFPAPRGPRSPSARGQRTSWEHLIGAP